MKKPLIGITSSLRTDEVTGWQYCMAYAPNVKAIERAGGLPLIIPVVVEMDTLRALYEHLDAILLPGGGDIDPQRYDADKHPATHRIDALRDQTELTIARWAVEDNRPLFGICRGHQVVNVAMGGTLIQDIPTQLDSEINHDLPNSKPRSTRVHEVTIDDSSRLASIIGKTKLNVNSLHHQSAGVHGPSVNFTAYAPDGVVEALEIPDRRFAISVQWHPEDMADDEAAQRLFSAFVEAARERANR
jgi:putative glutamine amidotransferase